MVAKGVIVADTRILMAGELQLRGRFWHLLLFFIVMATLSVVSFRGLVFKSLELDIAILIVPLRVSIVHAIKRKDIFQARMGKSLAAAPAHVHTLRVKLKHYSLLTSFVFLILIIKKTMMSSGRLVWKGFAY